jgi:hypothetical protein
VLVVCDKYGGGGGQPLLEVVWQAARLNQVLQLLLLTSLRVQLQWKKINKLYSETCEMPLSNMGHMQNQHKRLWVPEQYKSSISAFSFSPLSVSNCNEKKKLYPLLKPVKWNLLK